MIRAKSHPTWLLLASLAALPSTRTLLAAESGGVVINYCTSGPFHFDFSALPDSCSIDMAGPRCPQSQPGDLTFSFGALKAPGGILDLGPLDDSGLVGEYALPSAGYADSVPFQPRRLYAMKVDEQGYALFTEVNGFIGGCLHQEFRWRYNDAGNRFSRIPVAVRLEGRDRSATPGGNSRSGTAVRAEHRGIDARGRSLPVSRTLRTFAPGP